MGWFQLVMCIETTPGVYAAMLQLELALLLLLCLGHQSILTLGQVQEAADGSVCFNSCNGHGSCLDYACSCYTGYHGDDCGVNFLTEDQISGKDVIVPILGAGHFNLSRSNFTQTIQKNKLILVGFSSVSCHKCIRVEKEYERLAEALSLMDVPFARAEANSAVKSLARESFVTELPSLVLYVKNKPHQYKGVHTVDAVSTYIKKHVDKPATVLKSSGEVQAFVESRNDSSKYSISTVMVVGFFSNHEDIEEDDYEDFMEVAKELQSNEDVYFGVVTKASVAAEYKKKMTIDRTPSVMLVGADTGTKAINLDELYGESGGLRQWIVSSSVPLLGKLTSQTFRLYEKSGKPMLMLFLDLTYEHFTEGPGQIVGGRSGGVLNEHLLQELREVAREHRDRLVFVYADGVQHEDQMRGLGLFGGRERLPAIAFNTQDGKQIPFPESLPVNKDTLLQFCANFLNGKLRSKEDAAEMAKKALSAALPVNQKNKVARKERKGAPRQEQGISEQFGDGKPGDSAVFQLTASNFEEWALSDDKDVVIMFHAESCEPCAHFAVYFKRMAQRFAELAIPTLLIARMDVTNETPPADLRFPLANLPLVALLPAGAKQPPWQLYSGVGKMGPMMKWIQAHAAAPFDLPSLPHLNDKNAELYKQQVREREEALASERAAMRAMDEERGEAHAKSRAREKKADDAEF